MARNTIADVLADLLIQAEVNNVWGLPGDSLNGFTEALRKRDAIRWIGVRHEEVAALAAAGEADAHGGLTVCAGSCGPGNLHLINGLFEAQRSHVPMLAIAAQIPSSEIGLGYFQETHPQNLFKECSDYCELVSNAEQIPQVLEAAMNSAVINRSVSVIVLPGDVALAPAPERSLAWRPPVYPSVVPPNDALDELAEHINEASNVTILGGYGCEGYHDEVVALAAHLKAPVVHALRGKQSLEYDNPYDVGMTGLIGFSSGYYAMRECDLLIMLGTNFPYREFYPEHGNIVQIDICGSHLGRRSPLAMGVVGDIGPTLTVLLPRLQENDSSQFLDLSQAHYKKARENLDDLATPRKGDKPLHPQYLTARVSALADDDAVFTADVGTPTVWAARYIDMTRKRRLTGSFMHGSMAVAVPAAMGWQAACPGRQVVALAGDGGVTMLMGDLVTLVAENLPVKVVIYNNETLGFVAMEMKVAGYVDSTTDSPQVDFAKLAESLGIRGIKVTASSDGLDEALQQAFAHEGPVVVDVRTAKQELSMPPRVEARQARGFSLYMLRAVMNGRGDEVVELGRTNWWGRR